MIPRYIINFSTREMENVDCQYIVIGSGIAGLFTAIKASAFARVTVLTKKGLADSNTEQAQGGIAAAVGEADSPLLHFEDTLTAGAGLCEEEAVRILVNEGPDRVKELLEWGAAFDRSGGTLSLTREGAHRRRRILHAGDNTGGEIHRTLARKVKEIDRIEVLENHMVVDLLTEGKRCRGLIAVDGEGRLKCFWAPIIVLASGGAGQVYLHTTNPAVATGDGIALAYRAGAEVMDMEFVQFHPTALSLPGAPPFLISEALRGEGAYLRNQAGERFMARYHPLAELAPRDVVARAIVKEMERTGSNAVYLDVTHLDPELIRRRFPTVTAGCARYGIDITRQPVPVAPAAHYMMGGVRTDVNGATSVDGLYACGEVASLGVHGANRLASNSLLDGLVFGERIVNTTRKKLAEQRGEGTGRREVTFSGLQEGIKNCDELRQELRQLMWEKVGIIRDGRDLEKAREWFQGKMAVLEHAAATREVMETWNMLVVGELIARAALLRTESRGAHYRRDFPERRDDVWRRHIVLRREDA